MHYFEQEGSEELDTVILKALVKGNLLLINALCLLKHKPKSHLLDVQTFFYLKHNPNSESHKIKIHQFHKPIPI